MVGPLCFKQRVAVMLNNTSDRIIINNIQCNLLQAIFSRNGVEARGRAGRVPIRPALPEAANEV